MVSKSVVKLNAVIVLWSRNPKGPEHFDEAGGFTFDGYSSGTNA
jgi:hypothetical protein